MNIKKSDIIGFLLFISSYYWIISCAHSINAVNHTIQLETSEKWKNHGEVHLLRFIRNVGNSQCKHSDSSARNCSNINCDCNCNCGHDTTTSKSCIITALENIIKIKLMEIDLLMKIFRGNFESTALLQRMLDTPALQWSKLIDEYSDTNKTVSHLMKLFNKVFNVPNIKVPQNPNNFMSVLKNKTKQLFHSLYHSSYVMLPGLWNVENSISSIQEKVESTVHEFLENGVDLNNIASEVMNWTQKMFSRIVRGPSQSRYPKNVMDNMKKEYKSILVKILNSKSDSSNIMATLQNETLKMLTGLNYRFPKTQILQTLIENIVAVTEIPQGRRLSLVGQRGTGFYWWKIFGSLKTWLDFMNNIPLYIVQLFKSIEETLLPSKITKNHWQRVKTSPLLIGQCYSSIIDKFWGISRPGLSHMSYFTSSFWKHKSKHSSLWEKLKLKLNQGCICP